MCFCLRFRLSDASSEGAKDHLRVSKACPESLSESIHPEDSESGMNRFHLASVGSIFVGLGFSVARNQNLSVVPTLQGAGNKNKIDTASVHVFGGTGT